MVLQLPDRRQAGVTPFNLNKYPGINAAETAG